MPSRKSERPAITPIFKPFEAVIEKEGFVTKLAARLKAEGLPDTSRTKLYSLLYGGGNKVKLPSFKGVWWVLRQVKSVRPPADFRLEVKYADDTQGLVDMARLLARD